MQGKVVTCPERESVKQHFHVLKKQTFRFIFVFSLKTNLRGQRATQGPAILGLFYEPYFHLGIPGSRYSVSYGNMLPSFLLCRNRKHG